MHGVHVHLCEERSGSCDDGRNGDLSCLPELTDVARPDIPSNVLANIGPPVPLREEGVGHVESVVPCIVVGGLHHSGVLSIVEYALMGTLWVALPYLATIDEEVSGIADDECVLMIADAVRSFKGHEPMMGIVKMLIGVDRRVQARCCVRDVAILVRAEVRGHLCEVLICGKGIKQIGRNSGRNCRIDEVGEPVKVVNPIIEIFLNIFLFLVYVVGLGRSP
jgi:hypothetical protein